MRQQQFEQTHNIFWERLATTLTQLEQGKRKKNEEGAEGIDAFADDYRRLCHHLALARQRGYGPALVQRLNALVLRGHRQLYQYRPPLLPKLRAFVRSDFPRTVRQQWPWHLASGLSFGKGIASPVLPA